jgi:hypothetical protein
VTIRHARKRVNTGNYCVRGATQPIAPYNAVNCSGEVSLKEYRTPVQSDTAEPQEFLVPGRSGMIGPGLFFFICARGPDGVT